MPICFTSSSKRGPSFSFVTSSPPSPTSTNDTPLPRLYMHRWTFRRRKKLLAMRRLLAVKSRTSAPCAVNSIFVNAAMVSLRCLK